MFSRIIIQLKSFWIFFFSENNIYDIQNVICLQKNKKDLSESTISKSTSNEILNTTLFITPDSSNQVSIVEEPAVPICVSYILYINGLKLK